MFLDPFAVKRNMARSVNSQQTCDYILHCLKTTYKYFASPLSLPSANHKKEAKQETAPGSDVRNLDEEFLDLSSFSLLTLQSLHTSQQCEVQNGPEDSDCIIEEEEDVEECSDSDEEGEKEKVDMGKSSLSEDEEDEDVGHRRHHLDSVTTEDEEIFPVDEPSGEELLSDEEGSEYGTPASMEEDEEDVELAPGRPSTAPVQVKDERPENTHQKQVTFVYKFTRQAFTRGKVRSPTAIFPT